LSSSSTLWDVRVLPLTVFALYIILEMSRFSLASLLALSSVDFVSSVNVHQEQATALRRGRPSLEAQQADMHAALTAVLGSREVDRARLHEIKQRVLPMWRSLPTNEQGRVDRRSLRYGLHRYFMDLYSISIVGLEPLQVSSEHDEVLLLSQNLPSYVKTEMEGKAASSGFSLDDAVVMIATIERLVTDTDHQMLEDAVNSLKNNATETFTLATAHEILERFMIRFLLGDDPQSVAELEADRPLLEESIEDWPAISDFLKGQLRSFQHDAFTSTASAASYDWNPFKHEFSLADVDVVADSVTTSFGKYWATECRRTKQLLIDMDRTNTGRVTLADFYGAAMNGEWRFSESKEYLRQMGALDETSSWQGPKIVITNYIQASSNCIVSAPHYRVCCANECETILSELESAIEAPLATPAKVWEVLREHESADYAVRLSASLERQLGEIAKSSPGGLLPLHGRLFAQWLHYAFPHECPFPHKTGTTTALSPTEFGDAYLASEADMQGEAVPLSTRDNQTEEEPEWMSQWSHEEELLSEATHLHAPWERHRMSVSLLLGGAFVSVLVVAFQARSKSSHDVLPTSASKSHYC